MSRRAKKIEGKLKLGEPKFLFNTPATFVVVWNGVTMGATDGVLFDSEANLRNEGDRLKRLEWLRMEIQFIDGLRERLEVYSGLIRNWYPEEIPEGETEVFLGGNSGEEE